jgi:pimeloyl-ACP methyl ester carboxylesterase
MKVPVRTTKTNTRTTGILVSASMVMLSFTSALAHGNVGLHATSGAGFMTTIDGLDIHFIHVRSKHPNALPLIVTHGWPGSIIEELKIIDRLTNPTAYSASASDAFDIVIPSMPGYGFSGKLSRVANVG